MKVKGSFARDAAIVAVASSALMIAATTYGLTDLVFAQLQSKFSVGLAGSQEVPPVQTNATGEAKISAYDIVSDSITYDIFATKIQNVTAAHTHLGKPGENGPIVFTFFTYDPPRNEVFEKGAITADGLEGPLKGKKVSDLALMGANGSLYINIHTAQNPNGEIRGQVGNLGNSTNK
jgi:CHRD domain-containing protein